MPAAMKEKSPVRAQVFSWPDRNAPIAKGILPPIYVQISTQQKGGKANKVDIPVSPVTTSPRILLKTVKRGA